MGEEDQVKLLLENWGLRIPAESKIEASNVQNTTVNSSKEIQDKCSRIKGHNS